MHAPTRHLWMVTLNEFEKGDKQFCFFVMVSIFRMERQLSGGAVVARASRRDVSSEMSSCTTRIQSHSWMPPASATAWDHR